MHPLFALGLAAISGGLLWYSQRPSDDPEPTTDPVPPDWMPEHLASSWPARVDLERNQIERLGEAEVQARFEEGLARLPGLFADAKDERDRGYAISGLVQLDIVAQFLGLPRPEPSDFQ